MSASHAATGVRAVVLAVGAELLVGDIVNGNAAWLGERLTREGVTVVRAVAVGDDVAEIADAVRDALADVPLLLVTGGLGPTQDDLTREGLAAAAGVDLVRDPGLEAGLRTRFEQLRRDVPEMNYRQADLPVGAVALPNPRGSAPGLRLELLGGVAYAMPGVPHEMREMVEESVVPDLRARFGPLPVVVQRVLRTAGMWESAVAAAVAEQEARLRAAGTVAVAFLASGGQTRVRFTAAGATREEALALIAPEEELARAALGPNVYGADDDTLEGVVADLLRARSATVAVAESLTGGLVGAALSEPTGASDVYRGAVAAYHYDVKERALGVPRAVLEGPGAVSAECAEAMATGVRERMGATYGLSTTGVAGPTEQEGKPVGTVFLGLAGPAGTESREVRLPGDRTLVRRYAVVAALDLLRRHLVG